MKDGAIMTMTAASGSRISKFVIEKLEIRQSANGFQESISGF